MVRTLEGMRLVRNRYHGGDRDGLAHPHADCELVDAWGWVELLIGQGDMMAHALWDDWEETGAPRSMRSEWEAVKRAVRRARPGRLVIPAPGSLIEAAGRMAKVPDEAVRDSEQGLCVFCDGGWEMRSGPRGGKPRLTFTAAHEGGCPYAELRGAFYQGSLGDAG